MAWNETSYMIETFDGDEGGGGLAAWDSLNEQFAAAGVMWIRVSAIEVPEDGHYEIWFELDENTIASRSVYLGSGVTGQYFILTQRSPYD